jgi:hypothetical protein
MNKNIIIGISYCVIGQILIWFQSNSQFIWPIVKNYRFLISLISGTTISYLFIIGVDYLYKGFDSDVWPARIIPNVTGTIIFFILTYFILKQGLDFKNGLCIFLSFVILAIQIFLK